MIYVLLQFPGALDHLSRQDINLLAASFQDINAVIAIQYRSIRPGFQAVFLAQR